MTIVTISSLRINPRPSRKPKSPMKKCHDHHWLVVYLPLLKNMCSSMGRMTSHIWWKIKFSVLFYLGFTILLWSTSCSNLNSSFPMKFRLPCWRTTFRRVRRGRVVCSAGHMAKSKSSFLAKSQPASIKPGHSNQCLGSTLWWWLLHSHGIFHGT